MAGQKILQGFACFCLWLSVIIVCVEGDLGSPREIYNKSDLVGAESNRNSPKVVGVKKHKNYEIVVYEYDESGEKQKKSVRPDNSSENVDRSGEKVSHIEHPTAPDPVPLKPFKTSKSTTGSTTVASTKKKSQLDEDLEGSTSDEVNVSYFDSEEESDESPKKPETEKTAKKALPTTTTTTTTAKPLLPQPFRITTVSGKKKGPSSATSHSSSEEYYDEEYSNEDSSSSDDRSDKRKRTKEIPSKNTRPGSTSKGKQPKRFGGRDDDEDEYSDEDDDFYYDDKPAKNPVKLTSTTKAPVKLPRKPGSGRVTPKPFFPLIYDDDSDEYEDDDDVSDISARRPHRKQTKSGTSPQKLSPKRKNVTVEQTNETDEDESAWGIDKTIKCKDPSGRSGVCQEYARCSIYYQELMDDYDEPIDPTEYKCRLPTQVGICCPLVTSEVEIPASGKKKFCKKIILV